jgi:class 3 adenylate cyclase/tetratricopeptide (TPR) repeat protein
MASEAAPREERKVVSVLFADLVGFTARAEHLDPEDVRRILAPFHDRLRGELERHGGTVEKFIGDAVMAVFGAPAAHEDDPERAVRAALAIRDGLAGDDNGLSVRIGIATGEVLVDLSARPGLGEGMVAGDTVNLAARLETAADAMTILVDEPTYEATRDRIEFEGESLVDAKGLASRVRAWTALQVRPSSETTRARGLRTDLVGRDRERELLRTAFVRATDDSEPALVTLLGEPGIGKSRLVAEFAAETEAAAGSGVTWRYGRSLPYGEGMTYWALGEIVKAEAGILESDAGVEAQRRLATSATALIEDEGEAEWVAGHLARLVSPAGADREGAGSESFAAWRRYVVAMAERGPTAVVLEDLHWADDALLDFVDDLMDRERGVPLLLIVTARPELLDRRPTWGAAKSNAVTIRLGPLTDAAAAMLLASLLEDAVTAGDPDLLERVGGNPLFAEQYARELVERGSTQAEMPTTLHGLIAARIDRLRSSEKRVLQTASVVGKVFWAGAVAKVDGVERSAVEDGLRSLERLELVGRARRTSVAGDEEYAFRHVLIRDVAYGEIPRPIRAQRHAKAAAWIDALGRPEDHAELVAHHYRSAIEYQRASGAVDPVLIGPFRDACLAAGQRATALGSYDQAARFYAEAVETVDRDDPRRPTILLALGKSQYQADGSGITLLEEAYESLSGAGDIEGAAEAAVYLTEERSNRGDRATLDRIMARVTGLTAAHPDSRARARVLAYDATFRMMAGAPVEEVVSECDEALRIADELGDAAIKARALNTRGVTRVFGGDEQGLRDLESALEIARRDRSYEQLHRAQNNLAGALDVLGRLAGSRAVMAERAASVDRYGLADERVDLRHQEAHDALNDGRLDEFLAKLGTIEPGSGRAEYTAGPDRAYRALILYAQGHVDEATAEAEEAIRVGREVKDRQVALPPLVIGAWLASERGDTHVARRLTSELIQAGGSWALAGSNRVATELAWTLHDIGRTQELPAIIAEQPHGGWAIVGHAIARDDPVAAAEALQEIGYVPAEAYTRLRAAEMLAASGSVAGAAAQLDLVRPMLAGTSAVGWLARADAITARFAVRPS